VHAGQHQAPSEAEVASTNVNKEVRGEVQEDVKEEPSESQPEKLLKTFRRRSKLRSP
jgi:hypothetical protein